MFCTDHLYLNWSQIRNAVFPCKGRASALKGKRDFRPNQLNSKFKQLLRRRKCIWATITTSRLILVSLILYIILSCAKFDTLRYFELMLLFLIVEDKKTNKYLFIKNNPQLPCASSRSKLLFLIFLEVHTNNGLSQYSIYLEISKTQILKNLPEILIKF